MKNHASGAEYFKFETTPKFVGRFIEKVIREKDAEGADKDENKKAGAVIGYLFHDLVNEEETIIGASHAITKALETSEKDSVFYIEFLGKTVNAKKQPVNRFKVVEAETEEDEKELISWVTTEK